MGDNALFTQYRSNDQDLLSQTARFAELLAVWMPINYMEMAIQHEYFGHGAVVRQFADKSLLRVTKYTYSSPPPYGEGGAATHVQMIRGLIPPQNLIAIDAGGVNATAILGWKMQEKWMDSDEIDGRDSLLYLYSYHDLTNYTHRVSNARTSEIFGFNDGHDIKNYMHKLGLLYHQDLSFDSLKKIVLVNYLDPFTFYSLWAFGAKIYDNSKAPIPMLSIGNFKYLPSFRVMLSPNGPELYMVNYIKTDDNWFSVTLRHSAGMSPAKSYGAEVYCPRLWKDDQYNFTLGAKANIWNQPRISKAPAIAPVHNLSHAVGGAFMLEGTVDITDEIALTGSAGYKTTGFLPGEALDQRGIVQLGVSLAL